MFHSPSRHPRCIWLSPFRPIQSELYQTWSWPITLIVLVWNWWYTPARGTNLHVYWSLLTSRHGPCEQHWVDEQHQQHGSVCGDVVRNGVLKTVLTAHMTNTFSSDHMHAFHLKWLHLFLHAFTANQTRDLGVPHLHINMQHISLALFTHWKITGLNTIITEIASKIHK